MLTLKEFKTLHMVVDDIFKEAAAAGWGWPTLAKKAGLSYRTVMRLGNYDTVYPRSQTVFMLAKAVGFEVVLKKKGEARAAPRRFKVVG